jgi:hypothetical protein
MLPCSCTIREGGRQWKREAEFFALLPSALLDDLRIYQCCFAIHEYCLGRFTVQSIAFLSICLIVLTHNKNRPEIQFTKFNAFPNEANHSSAVPRSQTYLDHGCLQQLQSLTDSSPPRLLAPLARCISGQYCTSMAVAVHTEIHQGKDTERDGLMALENCFNWYETFYHFLMTLTRNIVRVIGASFGLCTASPAPWFIDHEPYFQMLFTLMWDLGLAFLLFDFAASTGAILQLKERRNTIYVWATLIQYGWLAATVLVIVAGQAMQGANITRSSSWTNDIQSTTPITLINIITIRNFFCAYYILCVTCVAALVPVNLTILVLPYLYSESSTWVKIAIAPTGTLQALGYTLFSLPLLVLTLIYSNARLWSQVAPTDVVQFTVSQVIPEMLVIVLLTIIKFLVSRWDWWRAEEIRETKERLKTFWEGEFLVALCFARQQRVNQATVKNTTRAGALEARDSVISPVDVDLPRSIRTVPVPWIVARASQRLTTPSHHSYSIFSTSSPYSVDLVETLKLLHRIAECVTEAVVLEPPSSRRTLTTLWRRSDERCVSLKGTEAHAAELLLQIFTPMTRVGAERLAREWTKVFAMDRTGGLVDWRSV